MTDGLSRGSKFILIIIYKLLFLHPKSCQQSNFFVILLYCSIYLVKRLLYI